jgi:hypothetical protein
VLTPLANERPSVASLHRLSHEIAVNAISVHSLGCNGLLGHYSLVVDPAIYLAASGNTPFVAPIHPGPLPTHAAGMTNVIMTNVNRQYDQDVTSFTTYRNTEAALKRQVIQAVPDTYTKELKDPILGFTSILTQAILQHLKTTYGTLTIDEMGANFERMNLPWSPNTSIETLFDQIREAKLFASATDPISDGAALRSALDNVEKSGVFRDAIRDFRKRSETTKTYPNFVSDFLHADAERRRQTTTKQAGLHLPTHHSSPQAYPPSITPYNETSYLEFQVSPLPRYDPIHHPRPPL